MTARILEVPLLKRIEAEMRVKRVEGAQRLVETLETLMNAVERRRDVYARMLADLLSAIEPQLPNMPEVVSRVDEARALLALKR